MMNKLMKKTRKINCILTKNLKDNHTMWMAKIKEEEQHKTLTEKLESIQQVKRTSLILCNSQTDITVEVLKFISTASTKNKSLETL